MIYVKSLSYLVALKVYFLCHNTVRHFKQSSYFYCLCDRYQGCETGFSSNNSRGYCCVCRTKNHYTLEKLEKIEHNLFQLEKFYLELLKDLNEIVTVDSTVCFWTRELIFVQRDWQQGTRNCVYLGNLIFYLFSSKHL